jgi:hypothetical protein
VRDNTVALQVVGTDDDPRWAGGLSGTGSCCPDGHVRHVDAIEHTLELLRARMIADVAALRPGTCGALALAHERAGA